MPSQPDLADVLRECAEGFEVAAADLAAAGDGALAQLARTHQMTLKTMAIMAEEIAELKARVAEWT